jgi:molybdopterin synthase sulfur carrier subunit
LGTIRLYATLRARADGERELDVGWRPGAPVGDVIRELIARKPGLEGHILDARGGVVPYVSVFVEGRDIRYLSGLETALANGDEIAIFPPVAGG